MDYEEKFIKKEMIQKGNIIDLYKYTVELPNGKEATRDVVVHPGASVVLPINENGEVYLVRQYRTPVGKELLELPAGKLDHGEDPKDCAIRELKEETGLEPNKVKHLLSFETTPGFSNEVLHLYLATDLHQGDSCSDEDEFVSTEKYHISKLLDMVINGEITDSKSIIGILMADKIIKGDIAK